MKLFLKVFISLFKIIVATAILIVSSTLDILILLENQLCDLHTKLYSSPYIKDNKDIYKQ